MQKNSSTFSKKLITWYLENKRELPWRKTADPYRIWLSEIILQQTRVAQGLPYFLKFTEAYPTVHHLAEASEDEVLKSWQGLGYYSRARNLHATAQYISKELDGSFPSTYKGLLRLKGVGDYTASAIASICFNEAAAVVDGNVYRVLSRYFGIETAINNSKGIKQFKLLAQELIDPDSPGNFNQAIMEFGARQCKPQNPDCHNCIFNESCEALRTNRVKELPFKPKNGKVTDRYFNYIVLLSEDNRTLLQQRTSKDIWQNLHEFPLIETDREVSLKALKREYQYKQLDDYLNIGSISLYNEREIVHKLSHRRIHTRFWIAEAESLPENAVEISQVQDYAVPVLIGNFISEFASFQQ